MKKLFIPFLLFCLASTVLYGQNQKVEPTNQTIVRLTIIKDNKILMRETEYGWMTPAVYFNKKQNINEILDGLTEVYGIKIGTVTLNGLFTYKYEFKPTADFRQLYLATYVSGQLTPTVGTEKISWMPIDEAFIKLGSTVQSLGDMTKQIIVYPDTLWGGSFILSRVNGKLTSTLEEKFYSLMKTDTY